MRTPVLSAVAVGMLMASAPSAQKESTATVYPTTEYISGKQGFGRPVKGSTRDPGTGDHMGRMVPKQLFQGQEKDNRRDGCKQPVLSEKVGVHLRR